MTLGKMIKTFREENDLSQREFARLCGISNVSVSYIERNENPRTGKPIKQSFETYCKIARVLGKDITEMFAELDDAYVTTLPSSVIPIDEIKMKKVPLIGKVAAGEPILAQETHEVFIPAPKNADYALEISGESMVPTFLPGDIVYIRKQSALDYQGQVAVVLLDDEATVKHVYEQQDGLLLVSDNPAYAPMIKKFSDYSNVQVLGKVCGFTRMF